MEDTDFQLSDGPMTGMLDTDSPDSGDSPATEGSGEGFLPDLPVLGHAPDWSMDNVASDNLTTILPEDSDQSPEAIPQDDSSQSPEAIPQEDSDQSQDGMPEDDSDQSQDGTPQDDSDQSPEAIAQEDSDQSPEAVQQVDSDQSPEAVHQVDSDQSQEAVMHQSPKPQLDPTGLGSVEKAVEQFQIDSAQRLQEEQVLPPPPPPPQEEQYVENTQPPPEDNTAESLKHIQQMSQELDTVPEPTGQDEAQDTFEVEMQMNEDSMELDDAPKENDKEPDVPAEPELPSEFEKLFKGCEDNPEDFNGWVYLLQYVEQENNLVAVRKAFDKFFLRYPYCYGYWKKYADIERKHGNTQVAEEVYRRGVQAIPLSVDLWLHYLTFLKENADSSDPETEKRIRAAYEHAVLAAGTDFRSDRLWEAYINWETEMEKLANVTAIFDRILGVPTQLYSQHFQRFKDHVQSNNPKHFLSEEEFVQLRIELSKAKTVPTGDDDDDDEPTPAVDDDLPPGTEDFQDPAKRVTEIENMRHKVIEARQEVFNHNEHEVSKRWAFEEGIKRPYFHVKALEKTQLSNWKEYLEFEIENGTPERVVVLFERCLIACALYEDFWTKYAKYLEGYSIEGVRHVYKRACTIHLPKKPAVHLLWAAFEEQQGNVEEARSVLERLEAMVPSLAMVRLRRVSLERRHGNLEEAEALLRDAMASGKNSNETSFYAVKLARQLLKVQRSLVKARKVLLDAIEKDQTSPKLYLNLLELEYSGDVQQNEPEILACFDRALNSPLPLESRLIFSQRKVEFLEDFGSDINALVAAYDEHQKLQKESDSTKRKAENGSQEPDAKRQRVDDSSGATQMTTDMQANNSAYNYNWYQQQYNNWGQNSWGQYNQYAGYNQYYPPPPT